MASPSLDEIGLQKVLNDVARDHAGAQSFPTHSTRIVSGTRHRMRPVTQLFAMSVAPAPKARQPSDPECGVCESVPMITWPGNAYCSAMMAWQMPSAPRSFGSWPWGGPGSGGEAAVSLVQVADGGHHPLLHVRMAFVR